VFKAEVTVKPEVELGQYKGIEVEKKEYNVTDEDVENELEILRNRNARIIDVTDRPVKRGDIVTIDFKGFIDDKEFDGGSAENYKLEVGSGRFIPGFEEQLIGATIGNEVDVNVTFPEDYRSEDLAGKPALFKVTVKEIKEKELLPLDDEFAKDVSEFDTLEELKADIKRKKIEEAERMAKNEYENDLIKKVVQNAKVDIPEVMIDNQIESMIRDFDYQLRFQGLDLDSYMKYMNISYDEMKQSYKEAAEDRVKTQLVMEAITKAENIEVTDEELEAEIEKTAKQYNQDVEKFKKSLRERDIEYIKEEIQMQKTIDFLVEHSVSK